MNLLQKGLMYVMLSRVTSRKKLKIVNNLQPLDIQPMLPWFLENVNVVVNWDTNTCIMATYTMCNFYDWFYQSPFHSMCKLGVFL